MTLPQLQIVSMPSSAVTRTEADTSRGDDVVTGDEDDGFEDNLLDAYGTPPVNSWMQASRGPKPSSQQGQKEEEISHLLVTLISATTNNAA